MHFKFWGLACLWNNKRKEKVISFDKCHCHEGIRALQSWVCQGEENSFFGRLDEIRIMKLGSCGWFGWVRWNNFQLKFISLFKSIANNLLRTSNDFNFFLKGDWFETWPKKLQFVSTAGIPRSSYDNTSRAIISWTLLLPKLNFHNPLNLSESFALSSVHWTQSLSALHKQLKKPL